MADKNKRPTQKETVLGMLEHGGWVHTNDFLRRMIPRFSARMFELQSEGHIIEKKRARGTSCYFYRMKPSPARFLWQVEHSGKTK